MKKILFVCHGNICRSPSAEFILKHMLGEAGFETEFEVASAATHTDVLGWDIYAPAAKKLEEHGIAYESRKARRITGRDYTYFDIIVGMDQENLFYMEELMGADTDHKFHLLLEFAGMPGVSLKDPWHTKDYELAWQELYWGCAGLFTSLTGLSHSPAGHGVRLFPGGCLC